MRATWLVLLFLLAAGSCKREQSFDEAMHELCELPKEMLARAHITGCWMMPPAE